MKHFPVLFALVLAVQPAFAKDPYVVSLTGECYKTVSKDRVSVVAYAEFVENDAGDASKKATDQYETLRDRTKRLRLKDAEYETVDYSVNEEVDWNNGKKIHKGYRARIGLQIETSELGRIGEVLKITSDMKIKNVSGLTTFVSNEKMKSERESCLETALKNARQKADKLAAAGGFKIGSVVRVAEFADGPQPGPMPFAKTMMMADAAESRSGGGPGLETSSAKLFVKIAAEYEIK